MSDSPDLVPLYDRDFRVWTVEQAALLRREAERRLNTDLDLLHLAEEIEAVGKRDRRALESHVARIVEHLLKLRFSPAADPRDGWIDTVDRHRSKVARLLRDSPSLERELPDLLPDAQAEGFRFAARGLARDGVDLAALCPSALSLPDILGWDDEPPPRRESSPH